MNFISNCIANTQLLNHYCSMFCNSCKQILLTFVIYFRLLFYMDTKFCLINHFPNILIQFDLEIANWFLIRTKQLVVPNTKSAIGFSLKMSKLFLTGNE